MTDESEVEDGRSVVDGARRLWSWLTSFQGVAFIAGLVALALVAASLWLGHRTGFLFEFVVMYVAAAVAAVTIPLGVVLLGPSMPAFLRTVGGNVYLLLSQMAYDGSAIIELKDGSFVREPLEQDDLGWFCLHNGRRIDIEADAVERIGWRPIAWGAEKHHLHEDAGDGEPLADGGEFEQTGRTSQGVPEVRPTDVAADSVLVDTRKFRHQLFGAAGAQLAREGKREALVEEGGTKQLGHIATLLASLVALFAGALSGLVAMGAI